MSVLQKVGAAVLVVLLAAVGYGLWTTSPTAISVRAQRAAAKAPAASAMPVIDQNTFLTAKRLARLATTAEEQPLAQAADADKAAIQDRLDLAQSQVELAQDEVQQADNDLLQAGGNLHQRIQMMQQEHDATERNAAATPVAAAPSRFGSLRGLVGQVRSWYAVHEKREALAEAQQHAADSARELAAERTQIAAELAASKQTVPELASRAARRAPGAGSAAVTAAAAKPASAAPAATAAAGAAPGVTAGGAGLAGGAPTLLNITRQIAAEQHRLTLRDQRITARRRLADIYGRWDAIVAGQERAILHACPSSRSSQRSA